MIEASPLIVVSLSFLFLVAERPEECDRATEGLSAFLSLALSCADTARLEINFDCYSAPSLTRTFN